MPHTQMAMELMAPWSSPISMALVVPSAWLHAPVASPCATGSVTRNHLANRGANTAPTTPASTTAAAAMPAAPPRLSGDAHRDGGGHALGQQRGSEHVLHLKQAAQGQHTAQGWPHCPPGSPPVPEQSIPSKSGAGSRYSGPAPLSPAPASS